MAGLFDFSALKIPGTYNPNTGAIVPEIDAPAAPTAAGILDGLFTPKTPAAMTNGDRWNVVGATLRDIGSNLRGQKPEALDRLQVAGVTGAGGAGKGKKGAAQPTDTALLYGVAKSMFPDDPKAQFLFATGNEDFLKSLSDNYGFHSVNGGDTYGNASEGYRMAPKAVDHDGVYGTQTVGGYTETGRASPSYQDTTNWQNAVTNAGEAVERVRHNGVQEGIDRMNAGTAAGQLGLGRQRLGFEVRNASANRTPGVVYVQSAADIDALPPGTPFIAVHDPYSIVRRK